jgi:hypothetical protein
LELRGLTIVLQGADQITFARNVVRAYVPSYYPKHEAAPLNVLQTTLDEADITDGSAAELELDPYSEMFLAGIVNGFRDHPGTVHSFASGKNIETSVLDLVEAGLDSFDDKMLELQDERFERFRVC